MPPPSWRRRARRCRWRKPFERLKPGRNGGPACPRDYLPAPSAVVRGGQPAHAFADLVHVGRGIRQPHGAGLGIGRIEGRAGHEQHACSTQAWNSAPGARSSCASAQMNMPPSGGLARCGRRVRPAACRPWPAYGRRTHAGRVPPCPDSGRRSGIAAISCAIGEVHRSVVCLAMAQRRMTSAGATIQPTRSAGASVLDRLDR